MSYLSNIRNNKSARKILFYLLRKTLRINLKQCWCYLSNMRKNKSAPINIILNDELLDNDALVVEGFATFFKNAYASYVDIILNNNINGRINISIPTDDDILKCVKKLGANMTMSPDKIPIFLIRDWAPILVEPLIVY